MKDWHRVGTYQITKYHEALRDLYKKYGPIFRQNWAGQEVLHIFDLEDVKAVLHAAGKMPVVPPIQEGSRIYRLKKNHSVGLGNLNGDDWYEMRSVVQQIMLKPREVQHYLPQVDGISIKFIDRLLKDRTMDGHIEDLHNVASKWFLENAGEILFEKRLGCLDGGESEIDAQNWIDSNRGIFYYNAILKVATMLYKYIPTRPWKKLVSAEDYFHKAAGKHIKETILKIKELTDSKEMTEKKYNLMAYFLSKEMDVKDIAFMCHSLISEGLSTVPSSIQYNIFCLAKNPHVQNKVREEVDKFIPKDGPITVDVLNNMSYLKASVKETFRMFPLGTEVSRVTQKDMVLAGYLVPAGTVIDLNHSSQLRSEKYFPNPNQFLPERWMRGSDATENAFILTPFGHGTRMCVGRRFALQSLYVAMARILQKFELVCSPEDELGQVFNTLLFPDRPVMVKFKERL
ncbi:probable cytochrome P450 CYP44 isoform X2 [Ischnura elegans]|uniref:probable cytochrome P450 CYP44 isoform X2 n=1 Tax=Ischnura elegans TaxID=197161 RepID=UPI001ED8809F|nr:probable cytochrome P450 CYP44 isoform X2 [Ischnura elegans]